MPTSPITCLAFSNKFTDIIAAGQYNGQVLFWDLRTDKPQIYTPSDTDKPKVTEAEKSHYDAVFDVVWPGGRTGAECISAAPDGRVLWWDWRNLSQGPITNALLTDGLPGDRVIGATRLDNSTEQPMKVLVGTEQGYVFQVIRKGADGNVSNRFGLEGGKHHGPIFAIQRNPAQNLSKYFMTIGDWTAKMWADDLKVPLITTRYHDAYLTDGCWSSTRPGIFFLTRSDGWIDIWDYYYRQNEICFSQKISDYPLTCMSVKPKTSDLLIGDASGSITLLRLCKSLWEPQPKGVEEGALKVMFEREGSREKTLLQQKKMLETRRAKELSKKEVKKEVKKKDMVGEKIKELEDDFFKALEQYQNKLDSGVMEGSGVFREEEKKEEKKAEEVVPEDKKEAETAEIKKEEAAAVAGVGAEADTEEKKEGGEEQKEAAGEPGAEDKDKEVPPTEEKKPEDEPLPEDQKAEPKAEVPAHKEDEEALDLREGLLDDLDKHVEEGDAKKEGTKEEEKAEVKPEAKAEAEAKAETEAKAEEKAEDKTDEKKEEKKEEEDARLGDDAHLALLSDAEEELEDKK